MLNAAKALAAEVEACHPEWAKGDKPDDAHEPKGAGQAGQKGEGISQTPPSQTPPSQPTQSGDAQNAPVPQSPAK